jgi:ribosomal protein S18 acetylase RimI-like enzyme
MPGSISLRPTTADDEDFLLQLYASTRSHELAVLAGDEQQKFFFVRMQYLAQRQHYLMSYPAASSSIILMNGAPAGRVIINRGESELTLVDISLMPEQRGLGIGTQLLTELLNEAAAASKPVRLHVLQSNPAKKLYERLGFEVVNTDQVYCEMISSPRHNFTATEG